MNELYLLTPAHGSGASARGRASLPLSVTAVLTDRLDDVAVADTAARLAVRHGFPLLLVAVLPPSPWPTPRPDGPAARAVLARVLPRVGRRRLGYIPVAYQPPVQRGSRLRAATGLLDLAARHRSAVVVASRDGPPGLDADTLGEAAAIRGGPPVHTAAPAPWTPLVTPSPVAVTTGPGEAQPGPFAGKDGRSP
ncbi:universal stress protein [Streptomyces sp. BRA346]|uniref:universal stress protein n=1 Tax=Streptomyces sp. BRA346 TaxID=2878199 RepID=UPI004062FA8E